MALLVVLLILAVMVVIAAAMSERLQIELRRTGNLVAGKQAWWYAVSAEALVAKALDQDARDDPDVTHLGQYWASKGTVFPVPDGQLKGAVRDLYGCFNLNSLEATSASSEKKGEGAAEPSRPYPARVFMRLLGELGLDDYDAVQLTDALRDWIDKDTVLISSYGAEDAWYESMTPPYLPANQRLGSLDELRMVRGVTPELYAKLAPYLCVRPAADLKVNVNTLSAEQGALLVALSEGKLPADEASGLLRDRPANGWKTSADFFGQVPGWDQASRQGIVVKSDRFEARLAAEVGDHRAFLVSELARDKDNQFRVVRRLQESGEASY